MLVWARVRWIDGFVTVFQDYPRWDGRMIMFVFWGEGGSVVPLLRSLLLRNPMFGVVVCCPLMR